MKKTLSMLMIAGIASGSVLAQGGTPDDIPLAITLSMPNRVGEWQEIRFTYKAYLNTTTNKVSVEMHDKGRGFAGNIAYLVEASGKTNVFGKQWVDPDKYPVPWQDYFYSLAPGECLKEQDIDVSNYFGNLSPGAYWLTILVPAERYRVPGVISKNLESKPAQFEVLSFSNKAARIVDAARKTTGALFLHLEKPRVAKEDLKGYITGKFVNRTKDPVETTTLDGRLPCDVAELDADAEWIWRPFFLGCGNVVRKKLTIQPGKEAQVRVHIPRAKGIYRVRVNLPRGKTVLSDPIIVE